MPDTSNMVNQSQTPQGREQIDELLAMLESQDIHERVTAIEILGEIGDERVLTILRERLRPANKELAALIAAVGKLKARLGLK